MRKDDLSDLYAMAKKATGGDWLPVGDVIEAYHPKTSESLGDICSMNGTETPYMFDDCKDGRAQRTANCRYIASVQPVVVLELIREIRALRKTLALIAKSEKKRLFATK